MEKKKTTNKPKKHVKKGKKRSGGNNCAYGTSTYGPCYNP